MKVTVTVHFAFGASAEEHGALAVNGPEILTDWNVTELVAEVLVTVSVVDLEVPTGMGPNSAVKSISLGLKLSTAPAGVGVIVGVGVAPDPVPDAGTVCGLPEALSVTTMPPFTSPGLVGVNVTVTVHVALGAREAGQLFEAVKGPVVVTLSIETD